MITRCKYLSTVKNIAHCSYREDAKRRSVENEKWNELHGKYILTEYVEPDCPDDALRNEKGQNACWIVEVEKLREEAKQYKAVVDDRCMGTNYEDDLLELINESIARQSATSIEAVNQAATPKMETTSCEWCNGKEYTIDSRDYTCLEITGNKLTAWGEGEATGHINYCPNCGRKLDWEED